MTKKKTVTVAEIKSLLIARFNAEQGRQKKIQMKLQRDLGSEIQEERPEVVMIRNKFADKISDIIARRLKQNRRTIPLISSQDFIRFIPSIINEIMGNELESEERKMFGKFMEAMFENIFEMVHVMVPPNKNLYDEYWRWITTVIDLATERDIIPTELFALEEMTDEITRRMFTRKQFITLSKKAVNKFMDVDALKKIIIQPMLDMVSTEADNEERCELEQKFESELMPQLHDRINKIKVVVNTFLGKEVERIYVTT